jgi:hypothetical protein
MTIAIGIIALILISLPLAFLVARVARYAF